jgi:hypothetical protein
MAPKWVWRKVFKLKEGEIVRKIIFSVKVFVTLLGYLKIPQVAILGELYVWRVLASSSGFLYDPIVHQTACPNPSPKPFSQSGRLWTFDLDKSQVRGKYDCVRDIRRSHCQPLCACVFAQLEWAHARTLLIKRKLPCQDFVSYVSVFGTGVSLIPTLGPWIN